jgi:hypothetical protein
MRSTALMMGPSPGLESVKMNDYKWGESYPDGTVKTFYIDKDGRKRKDLNKYGYQHRDRRCPECGAWECDPEGVGHYRG